eukprot:COSAG04_NODE_13658_length_597_cov_0.674699_1_plen_154_part_10
MADLETSIAFGYGSLALVYAALPSVTQVVKMLLRHTALTLSIEAHCGLEAGEQYAEHFTRRRALAVRRAMERILEDQGHDPELLRGRLVTRAWGNSRPLIWAHGEEPGARNRRVELYLSHGDWEAPQRRPLADYAREPGAPEPQQPDEPEAAAE